MSEKLVYRTASELALSIRERSVAAAEVVDAFVTQIHAHNPELNAVVTLDEAGARERARRADECLARGELWGPLHGVPVTVKDLLETRGMRTTAGFRPLADYVPERDATVVERLVSAGAIVVGKTNTPACGFDTQSDNAIFGATMNPWCATRTPGGSSGGEAAALASGMSALGVGSDLGGSLRIPAHYCGVFALKPTEGRIPFSGHIPPLPNAINLARHMSVVGPMARSIEDLRLALSIVAGPDGQDPAAVPVPLGDAPDRSVGELRIAWTDDFGGLTVSRDTRSALEALADTLSDAGCRIERVSPPDFDFEEVWRTFGELHAVLFFAAVPASMRYMFQASTILFGNDMITAAQAKTGKGTVRRYFEILDKRDRLSRSLSRFLKNYDAWMCPVSMSPAFPHRGRNQIQVPVDVDGTMVPGRLATTAYTCPFNVTGHPAVVLPVGRSADGLPIGVQLVATAWSDMSLLASAAAVSEIVGPFRAPPEPGA